MIGTPGIVVSGSCAAFAVTCAQSHAQERPRAVLQRWASWRLILLGPRCDMIMPSIIGGTWSERTHGDCAAGYAIVGMLIPLNSTKGASMAFHLVAPRDSLHHLVRAPARVHSSANFPRLLRSCGARLKLTRDQTILRQTCPRGLRVWHGAYFP